MPTRSTILAKPQEHWTLWLGGGRGNGANQVAEFSAERIADTV
jgi:hypothetical protein